MYERTRVVKQGREEEHFILALHRWLDGDDQAIDDWLTTL
jgi:hypothetical protein